MLELTILAGVMFITSNVWFYLRVLRPVQRLSVQASRLTQGELDAMRRPCGGVAEVSALRRAMAGMVGHVRRAQEQSRAYADRLTDGQEGERKRIARELHDDTIQSLIAITQSIDLTRQWLQTDPTRAGQMLAMARLQSVETVAALRDLIGGLRPPALEELGLIPALEMQAEQITTPTVTVTAGGVPRRLDEMQELALFRIAQEALNNSLRHGGAAHIDIRVMYAPAQVTLQIHDDGCGFNPPDELGEMALEQHYGLLGIQERAAHLGGQLTIESVPAHHLSPLCKLP